jgi:hypothetical protein
MAEVLTFQHALFDEPAERVPRSTSRVARVLFDDSETEDIVLVRTPIGRSELQEIPKQDIQPGAPEDCASDIKLAEKSSIGPARDKLNRPPKRIGNGKLVATRVQWRPGDPFGQATRAPARGFEWNRMVRSACVTAACGLLLVWLLHIA